MPAETMSGRSAAVGVATSIGRGSEAMNNFTAAPNIGDSINVGGTHEPSLNSNIFSMSELTVSPDSFNMDRAIPGTIAFDNTRIEIQAPSISQSEPFSSPAPTNALSAPEAKIMQELNLPITNPIAVDIQHMPDLDLQVNNFTSPKDVAIEPAAQIEFQEVKADVAQAVRVKKALVGIGMPDAEAQKNALSVLAKTEEKKSLTAVLEKENARKILEEKEIDPENTLKKPEEKIPVHDEEVNANRVNMATEIAEQVIKEADEDGKEPTGSDLVKEMPTTPQEKLTSGIVKGSKDGSYDEFIDDLGKIEKIDPDKILSEIQTAMKANSAVDLGQSSAKKATKKEVTKVLNGRKETIIFQN
ncbi:MAG: hypothetical protein Q7R51_01710 [bacterium]|nr:hypothetical protein [bacterium]